jgi:hypothetical protein
LRAIDSISFSSNSQAFGFFFSGPAPWPGQIFSLWGDGDFALARLDDEWRLLRFWTEWEICLHDFFCMEVSFSLLHGLGEISTSRSDGGSRLQFSVYKKITIASSLIDMTFT